MTALNKYQEVEQTYSYLNKIINFLLKKDSLKKTIKKNKFLDELCTKILIKIKESATKKVKKAGIKKMIIGNKSFKIIVNPKQGPREEILHFFFYNNVDPKISELIKKNADKNKSFIDIGANIGYHSLYASHFFKEVIAFEPLPTAINQFKESIKLNGFKNIKTNQLACSDKEGKTKIYYYKDNLETASLNNSPTVIKDNQKPETTEIKKITLDQFLKRKKNKIGLIKIDAEGHEPFIIEGMKKTIEKHKPTIIMEILPTILDKIKKGKTQDLLNKLNKKYELTDIEEEKKIRNIEKYVKHVCEKKGMPKSADILLKPLT